MGNQNLQTSIKILKTNPWTLKGLLTKFAGTLYIQKYHTRFSIILLTTKPILDWRLVDFYSISIWFQNNEIYRSLTCESLMTLTKYVDNPRSNSRISLSTLREQYLQCWLQSEQYNWPFIKQNSFNPITIGEGRRRRRGEGVLSTPSVFFLNN